MTKKLTKKQLSEKLSEKLSEQLSEELSEHTEVLTPGLMLSEARVSLQLTPKDIARRLNLREPLILALENNEFDEVTSVTFTRGYLKAYAKLVHVDEQDILAAFEYWNNAEQQQLEMQSFSHRSSRKAMDNWLSIFSYLVILVILIMAIIWWLQRNDADGETNSEVIDKPNSTQVVNQAVNTDASPDPANPLLLDDAQSEPVEAPVVQSASVVTNGVTEPVTDTLIDAASQLASESTPESESIAQSIPESTPDSALDTTLNGATDLELIADQSNSIPSDDGPPLAHLELRFSDSCWINIADARGERIAIGTKNRGHLTSVYGQAPFTIKLGKPDAVSIWLEGEQREIPFYPKGRVANFELALKTVQ